MPDEVPLDLGFTESSACIFVCSPVEAQNEENRRGVGISYNSVDGKNAPSGVSPKSQKESIWTGGPGSLT